MKSLKDSNQECNQQLFIYFNNEQGKQFVIKLNKVVGGKIQSFAKSFSTNVERKFSTDILLMNCSYNFYLKFEMSEREIKLSGYLFDEWIVLVKIPILSAFHVKDISVKNGISEKENIFKIKDLSKFLTIV